MATRQKAAMVEVLTMAILFTGAAGAAEPNISTPPQHTGTPFWAQAKGHEATVGGVWMMETAEPESEQAAWLPPVRVTDGVMMCKPIVLSTGEADKQG